MCIMGRERKLGWPGVTGPKTDTVGGLTEARGGECLHRWQGSWSREPLSPWWGQRPRAEPGPLCSPEVM